VDKLAILELSVARLTLGPVALVGSAEIGGSMTQEEKKILSEAILAAIQAALHQISYGAEGMHGHIPQAVQAARQALQAKLHNLKTDD
jgi:hypothetical protein